MTLILSSLFCLSISVFINDCLWGVALDTRLAFRHLSIWLLHVSSAKFLIPYCTLHRIFHQWWNKVYFSDICLLRRRNLRHSKTWVSPTLEKIILCNISCLNARHYLSSYSWGMLAPTWVLMHAIVLIACKLWFRNHPSLKPLRSFHRLFSHNIIRYLQLLLLSPSCRPLCRFGTISRFLIHLKRSGPFSFINPMLFHHILFCR